MIDFIQCISFTNSIFHQIQLLETETQIKVEQDGFENHYNQIIEQLEKDLDNEFSELRLETKLTMVEKRTERAKDIIRIIQESKSP